MRKTVILPATLLLMASGASAGEQTHWGYSGDVGPGRWGQLSADFAACADGRNQSPVNLAGPVEASLPAITIGYQPGGEEIVNNGHTVQVNYADGSALLADGRRYELEQFHFHAPSENHVQGKSFPLEAHLVHADAQGNLAVVAVLFERGEQNTALAGFWDRLPGKAGDKAALSASVDAGSLLPVSRDYYRFNGSLTTPPCSEGVLWLVMKETVGVSAAQVSAFTAALGGVANNRPLQPLNARVVLKQAR